MGKLGCICGHVMYDQTDFLPYKARILADEDTQKPIEILADLLARYVEAREQGRGAEIIREAIIREGEGEAWAEEQTPQIEKKPLHEVFFDLIFPFWNRYDRQIFECEQCGRLWVQYESERRFVAYMPESDKRHVLWSRHNHNPYGELDE